MRIKAASLDIGSRPLEHRIVVEIVQQAVDDWKKVNASFYLVNLYRDIHEMGYTSPRRELLDFWYSDWCETLFGYLPSMAYSRALKALGVPKS